MIWGILSLGAGTTTFLILFIRSAIANGKLRAENTTLKETIAIQQKELKVGAEPLASPTDVLQQLRDKKL